MVSGGGNVCAIEPASQQGSQSCYAVRLVGRTNRENRGLISADRKTSLLSRLQYPVSLKSSTMDFMPDDVKLRSRVMLGRSLSLLM